MLPAWKACLCKWEWQRGELHLSEEVSQEEWEEQPSPKYPPGEAPHAGRKLQSHAGKPNSGRQCIGYSPCSGLGWLVAGQPPARCVWTGMEQPPALASLFLLLPFAVLLSRLCLAHHHPQGTSLGVPHLQRVSPWLASLVQSTQKATGNQVKGLEHLT